MANILKQIKVGNTTYNIEPYTSYLPLAGGAMTGPIYYQGTKAKYAMIKWIDNTADNYGNGIRIGGGGATIIGGGESADLPSVSGGDEILYLMNDGNIDFYSNCQEGLSSAKHMTFDVYGTLNVPTNIVGSSNSNRLIFRHLDGQNCNGNYDLYLQYHQRNTKIYLNGTDYYIENGSYYNGTAAAANSVAWGNVTGKPSTFPPESHTHDDRYYTESEINSKLDGKSNTGHTHAYLPLSGGVVTGETSFNDFLRLRSSSYGIQFNTANYTVSNMESGSVSMAVNTTSGSVNSKTVTFHDGAKGLGSWHIIVTPEKSYSHYINVGTSNISNSGFTILTRTINNIPPSQGAMNFHYVAVKYW